MHEFLLSGNTVRKSIVYNVGRRTGRMKREAVWKDHTIIPERETLLENVTTEVAVIGAGMAGILTACFLQHHGKHVVVLEADRIGSGQTGNTTAKITIQHGFLYDTLIRTYGKKKAADYIRANQQALNLYEQFIKEKQIDCNFERLPSYLYSVEDRELLIKEASAVASLGVPSRLVSDTKLPFEHVGAVCIEDQAQLEPLRFLKEMSKELTIYEKTKVLSVSGHKITTDRAEVQAEYIVIATHYPIINLPGFYFMRQHQERSYVLALSGADRLHGMYYSADKDGISLRSFGDFLLIGGGAHRTGKLRGSCGYTALRQKAEKYYPTCKEEYCWSAQDCITHDNFPFIGRYSIFRPYWYVISGFKKWGMTSSMLAAMLISDEICGRKNPYRQLFSPQRIYPVAAAKNFFIDMGESIKGLSEGAMQIFSKETPRCSHMGCALQWNPQEKMWECPCHGSRFGEEGSLADNPAKYGIKHF